MTKSAEVKSLIHELAAKAVLCDHVAEGACLECIVNFGQAIALATYEDAARQVCPGCAEGISLSDSSVEVHHNKKLGTFFICKAAAIQRRSEEVRK